jgi:hypothetical protein
MIDYDLLLSQTPAILFLYAGPDQILPLVSILGTVIGFLLIMWRRIVGLIKRGLRSFSKKPVEPVAKTKPSPELNRAMAAEPATED